MASSDRFRSFAERYVIARAAFFRLGHEEEDAWAAVATAKSVYRMAASMGKTAELDPDDLGQNSFPGSVAGQARGATGGQLVGSAKVVVPEALVVPQVFSREQQRIMGEKKGWWPI